MRWCGRIAPRLAVTLLAAGGGLLAGNSGSGAGGKDRHRRASPVK